jgi:hypothetical protein
MLRHPVLELDSKPVQCGLPIPNHGHRIRPIINQPLTALAKIPPNVAQAFIYASPRMVWHKSVTAIGIVYGFLIRTNLVIGSSCF